jgi:hypothetical protein
MLAAVNLSSRGQSTVDASQAASWSDAPGAGGSTAHVSGGGGGCRSTLTLQPQPAMLNSSPVRQTSSRRIVTPTIELLSPRNNFVASSATNKDAQSQQ